MIDWDKIETKGKTSGQIKTKCPACIDRRTNKKDTSLSVNLNSGVARCHYCDEISIRDKDDSKIEYKIPKQDWKNYTKLSEKVVKWFEQRKISQSTIINCGITEEKYYQPALQKNVQNIVYNYFEGEKLVNKKYRGPGKKFTQSSGTKNIFYGINDVIGQTECYIVEGEMDKLALYEIGIKNAISVPNGANDNDDVWENSKKYLEGIETFYIATDCDAKGNDLSDKISQRLGRWKCLRVEFKNKDANDDLIEGKEVLENSIKSAKRFPVSGTFTAKDIEQSIFDLYENGLPKTIYPKHKSFGHLKDIFTVMRGHLVTVTGIPSHGKSSFTEWYIMNLVNDYNMKASFFSPEHSPMELHQSSFAQRFWGKPFFGNNKMTTDELKSYIDWSDEKIYLTSTDKDDFPTWDWIFDKFKEQMYSFGIDIFVIDAFNKLSFSKKGNKLDLINEVLSKLTIFAQMNNVIIFLVAHPTKMQKNERGVYSMPSLYDVSGSADFRNQTHDGYGIYRHFGDEGEDFTEFVNLKTKYSFQGKMTEKVEFDYHIQSGRYYLRHTTPCLESLIDFNKEKEFKEEKQLPLLMPKDSFDIDYESEGEIDF